jgi:TetR/AcrR family transcriptional regulator, transcriptional repressor for nem operon
MSKAERTSQFIIEKAAPIFNKKGYAGTSLNDLIEATGLTKGAIYGNFNNKDEVALAAFDYNLSYISKPITEMIRAKENSVEKLLAIPEFYKKWYVHFAERGGCAMLNAAVEADDNHPLLKKKVAATVNNWKKSIEKIILSGISNKEIKSGIDPSKMSSTFIALIEGGIMMSKITDDTSHLNAAMERMEQIINMELRK